MEFQAPAMGVGDEFLRGGFQGAMDGIGPHLFGEPGIAPGDGGHEGGDAQVWSQSPQGDQFLVVEG